MHLLIYFSICRCVSHISLLLYWENIKEEEKHTKTPSPFSSQYTHETSYRGLTIKCFGLKYRVHRETISLSFFIFLSFSLFAFWFNCLLISLSFELFIWPWAILFFALLNRSLRSPPQRELKIRLARAQCLRHTRRVQIRTHFQAFRLQVLLQKF